MQLHVFIRKTSCFELQIEEKDIEDEIPSSKLSADKTDYDSGMSLYTFILL